jgi:hypothetical protein
LTARPTANVPAGDSLWVAPLSTWEFAIGLQMAQSNTAFKSDPLKWRTLYLDPILIPPQYKLSEVRLIWHRQEVTNRHHPQVFIM